MQLDDLNRAIAAGAVHTLVGIGSARSEIKSLLVKKFTRLDYV